MVSSNLVLLLVCATFLTSSALTVNDTDLFNNALCIVIGNTSLSEWSILETTMKSIFTQNAMLVCSRQPSLCNASPSNSIFFALSDVIIINGYPQPVADGLEVGVALQVPMYSTPLSLPAVVPVSTLETMTEFVSYSLKEQVNRTVVETTPCRKETTSILMPTPTYTPISKEISRDNMVIITIGLTTLQHWSNDANLQQVFKEVIANEGTDFCSIYFSQCGLENNSSVNFTSSDVVFQPGYPRQLPGMNLQVAIILCYPANTNLTILVPGNAMITIALRAATPFYIKTGRSFTEISSYEENNMLSLGLGIGIPGLLLLLTIISLLSIYCTIKKHKKLRNDRASDDNYQLPQEIDNIQLLSYRKFHNLFNDD